MVVNLILTSVFLIIIGFSVWHGIFRKLGKARVRGIGMVIAGILAVVLTVLTKNFWVSDSLLDGVLAEMGNETLFVELMDNSPTLGKMLFECLASLIAPLLCLIYFIVLSFVAWIVYLIVTMVCAERLKRHSETCRASRLRAAIWGGVWGCVICVMIMVPISGYMELASPVAESVLQADILSEGTEESLQNAVDEYIAPVDSGISAVYRAFGGGLLVDTMTDFSIEEQDIDFSEELGSVSSLACGIIQLTDSAVVNYGSHEAVAVNAVADAFQDSVLLPQIAGELVYSATDSWLDNRSFLGIAPPTAGSMANLFDPFLNTLFEILHRDAHNHAALQGDIRTVANMMNIFVEHRVFENLSSKDRLMTALSRDGIIGELIIELGENSSMKALIPEVTNLGVRAIAISLDIPTDSDEVYAEFLASIANAVKYTKTLPEEQRVQALADSLKTSFDEAGVSVDEELLICYALSMTEDLIDNEQATHITADDVRAFFLVCGESIREEPAEADMDGSETVELGDSEDSDAKQYDPYENTVYEGMTYQDLKKTGAYALAKAYSELLLLDFESVQSDSDEAKNIVTEIYGTLWENDPDKLQKLDTFSLNQKLSPEAYRIALGLGNAKTFVTYKVLLCDLVIDAKEAVSRLEADGLTAEAEAISQMFVAANEVYKKLEYGSNIGLSQIANPLGKILDAFELSACYGEEKTAGLFMSIMQSERVRESANLDLQTATSMAKKVTEGTDSPSYQKTVSTLSKAVDVMNDCAKGDGQLSDEQLAELIKDTNRQNAAMMEIYATSERLESYNVDPKYSEISSELLGKTFHAMADTSMNEAQYANEAKALNNLMNVMFTVKENTGSRYLFTQQDKVGVFAGTAEETVALFMSSDALMSALRDTLLTEDGEIRADRFDLYDLGAKQPLDSTDKADCLSAMQRYYEQDPREEVKQNLCALSALFGISESPIA